MEPAEERAPGGGGGGKPHVEIGKDLSGRSFRVQILDVPAGIHPVAVQIESLVEAEPGIEDEGGNERGRLVSFSFQNFGKRLGLGREEIIAVVADAVEGGIGSGHDRGVGRQGEGDRSLGPGEADRLGGQCVYGRRASVSVAVGSDMIGPGRVQGDE